MQYHPSQHKAINICNALVFDCPAPPCLVAYIVLHVVTSMAPCSSRGLMFLMEVGELGKWAISSSKSALPNTINVALGLLWANVQAYKELLRATMCGQTALLKLGYRLMQSTKQAHSISYQYLGFVCYSLLIVSPCPWLTLPQFTCRWIQYAFMIMFL
jgi:hypothetical protein